MRSQQSTSQDVVTPQPTPIPLPSSDPSCFELLDLLRRRLTVARLHIVARATMAQKDEEGRFTWVEFDPRFHLHLFKCVFSLLGNMCRSLAFIWDFISSAQCSGCQGALIVWESMFHKVISWVYKSSYSRCCIATCLLAGPNKHNCFRPS